MKLNILAALASSAATIWACRICSINPNAGVGYVIVGVALAMFGANLALGAFRHV